MLAGFAAHDGRTDQANQKMDTIGAKSLERQLGLRIITSLAPEWVERNISLEESSLSQATKTASTPLDLKLPI
jgi:hypothetical protein